MIVAAGLTPAWQQILEFETLAPGEVNRARRVTACASGKVLNVGLGLHFLGAASRTVALVGGLTGQAIRAEFAALGAEATWVEDAHTTRVCTTVLESAPPRATELVENAAAVDGPTLDRFAAAFGEAARGARLVVLSGSLPAGAPMTYYRDLLRSTAAPAVLDIRGPELLAVLDAGLRPRVVKPNRAELAATVGRRLDDDGTLREAMQELVARGAEWLVVTDGPRPVWVVGTRESYRLLPPPAEQVVNPIGCGDSLTAGIAWALARGDEIESAVRLGMAAAADNLRQLLPARLDAARMEAASVRVERLSA